MTLWLPAPQKPFCHRCKRVALLAKASLDVLGGQNPHCSNLAACKARCKKLAEKWRQVGLRLEQRPDVQALRRAERAQVEASNAAINLAGEISHRERNKPKPPSFALRRNLELAQSAAQRGTIGRARKIVKALSELDEARGYCGPCGYPLDECQC